MAANNYIFDTNDLLRYEYLYTQLHNQIYADEVNFSNQIAKKADLIVNHQTFRTNAWTPGVTSGGIPYIQKEITFATPFKSIPLVLPVILGTHTGLTVSPSKITNRTAFITVSYTSKASKFDSSKRNHIVSVASIGV